MKLSVPVLQQSPKSVDCGIASVAMIYAFYRIKKEYSRLQKELTTNRVGTYAPQLGINLLQNGFQVEIVTHNPRLVEVKDKNLNQKQLASKFTQELKRAKNASDKRALKFFMKFMGLGGKITIKVPTISDIKEEIESKRPLIAYFTNAPLYDWEPDIYLMDRPIWKTMHIAVVSGIDPENVYINDPMWDNNGGQKSYPIEQFFYAVYTSALGDLDNACLMKIRRG